MSAQIKKLLIAYHRFPPIAQDLARAFIRLGVDVQIFYTTDHEHWFYRKVIRTINRQARNFRLVPKGTDLFKTHPLNLVNHVSHHFMNALTQYCPDAVLVIHGLPFKVPQLKDKTIPIIGWHLEPRDDLPYLMENAKRFSVYNSFSQKDVQLLTEAGFDARYLSHGVDLNSFRSTSTGATMADVAFVGNWSPWRDQVVQAALEVSSNVVVYGDNWLRKSNIRSSLLRQVFKGRELLGDPLNRLFNSSRVVLNASRTPGSYGLNMRFFEVLAAGGLLLTDAVPELEKHFVPGTHLLRYEDVADLKVKLAALLADSAQQHTIRAAGQALVRERDSYDEMAKHLLSQISEVANRLRSA